MIDAKDWELMNPKHGKLPKKDGILSIRKERCQITWMADIKI